MWSCIWKMLIISTSSIKLRYSRRVKPTKLFGPNQKAEILGCALYCIVEASYETMSNKFNKRYIISTYLAKNHHVWNERVCRLSSNSIARESNKIGVFLFNEFSKIRNFFVRPIHNILTKWYEQHDMCAQIQRIITDIIIKAIALPIPARIHQKLV